MASCYCQVRSLVSGDVVRGNTEMEQAMVTGGAEEDFDATYSVARDECVLVGFSQLFFIFKFNSFV